MGKISDEIRKWCGICRDSCIDEDDCDKLRALADRIDAEMVELPRDMDGAPVHIGDTVYLEDGGKVEVERIVLAYKKTTIDFWTCGKNRFFSSSTPMRLTHNCPDSFECIADDMDNFADANYASGLLKQGIKDFADRIRKLAKDGE